MLWWIIGGWLAITGLIVWGNYRWHSWQDRERKKPAPLPNAHLIGVHMAKTTIRTARS